jgi:hypothetical protein
MKTLLAVLAVVIFLGCGQQLVLVREYSARVRPEYEVSALKGVSEVHSGTTLFVNQSVGVWQKCLIFDGYYSWEQLVRFGPDGMPVLKVAPIGYFEIGPSESGSRPIRGEALVGFFLPSSDYTLMAVAEDFTGNLMAINIMSIWLPPTPMREEYFYYSFLGFSSRRIVNHLVYLPNVSPGHIYDNNLRLDIDLNDLVRRGARKMFK